MDLERWKGLKKILICIMSKSIINWSAVSDLLANNRDSIRAERFPDKYINRVALIKRFEQYLLQELKETKG